MGFFHRRLVHAFLASAIVLGSAEAVWNKAENKALKIEDSGFWDRILEDVASSIGSAEPSAAPVMTTPPPVITTSAPTAVPTRAPVEVPSTPPPVPTTSAPVEVPTTPPPIPTTPVPTTSVPTTSVPTTSAPTTPAPTTSAPIAVPTTPPPVEVPTDSPTLSPVVSTSDPTLSGCFLEASISCLDGNGIPCFDLVPPSGQCSNGTGIEILTFTILPSTCEESTNPQEDSFVCEGVDTLPEEGTAVVISCQDELGSEFFGESTSIGSSVVIPNPPDAVTCVISESDSGDQLQTVTIDTSGEVDLFLKDKYGMLEITSCQGEELPLQTCNVPVLYTYMLENTGPEALDVTALQRNRNGVTVDLFERVEGANPLLPGDSVSIAEAEIIDICMDGLYETLLVAEANPLVEPPCDAVATYVFEIVIPTKSPTTTPITSEPTAVPPSLPPVESTIAPASSAPSQAPVDGTPAPSFVSSLPPPPSQPPVDATPAPSFVSSLPPPPSQPPVDATPAPSFVSSLPPPPSQPPVDATPAPSFVSSLPPPPSQPPVDATPAPSAISSPPPVDATAAPTDDCGLLIEIGCIAPFQRADCNDIPPLITECLESPSELVMQFNGGDCGGSFNIQPDSVFQCEDAQDGPPTETGTASYIVATGVETQEEYFAGFVEVGEDFTLLAGSEIAANTNVVIYDPSGSNDPDEIVASGKVMQTVTFQTSCIDFLFLKDRFGAVQLTEFVNGQQGRVTCFQTVTLTFTMELPEGFGEGTAADLTGLTVVSNIESSDGETLDLSPLVIGSTVTQTTSVTVEQQFELDLTQRKRYTNSATIVGETDTGKICSGNDRYQFTAGNPLPPTFPTVTPTVTPTISPFPTPDPEESACEVDASISCAYADGLRCDLKSPVGSTCLGSSATFLQFSYVPSSSCATGNNTSTNFQCEDLNTAAVGDRPTTVYIRMLGGVDEDEEWYSGVVTEGQIVDMKTGRGDALRIEISTAEEGGAGELLQESLLNFECIEASALTLMDYFGSMQLVGFHNAEMGLQQVFANVEITYTATNAGRLDMELFGAFGSSPFSGFQDFLNGQVRTLSTGEGSAFKEQFTLNLDATAGSEFQFTFLAQGQGSTSEVACDGTDAFTLTVQG